MIASRGVERGEASVSVERVNGGLDAGESGPGEDLVTVVIPARNEERFIAACLDSVQSQDYPRLQIIVVDGASDDHTAEIVRGYVELDGRVELLINPDRIIPRSLNLALGAARGRWLVRVDAHAAVPADYVRRAVAHLRTGDYAGVGGRKNGVGVTPAGRAIAAAMASRFGVGNSTYHYGTEPQTVEHVPFGAYSVDVARRLGGWDQRLVVNQDFEFDYRIRAAGMRLLFDPELVIEWHCRQSVPDLYRQYRRYGKGKVTVAALHPRSVRLRHLMAPMLVASGALAATVAVRRPGWGAALVAPYAALLLGSSVRTARKLDSPGDRIWVAPAFAAMHVGWGVGSWQGVGGLLASRRRQTLTGAVAGNDGH
jgi:cellulose synthase/poly-beta-1,6-N-acetylglucosamine synthase-like glycosyltransferase